MDLLALADFNLVARHGGFGRGAHATGRGNAALSRQIDELESDLAAGRLVHWGDIDGREITLSALYPSRRLLSTLGYRPSSST